MGWPIADTAAMDIVTQRRRSEIMAAIRSKDTAQELAVRRVLAAALRYRLHAKGLLGRPNLIFLDGMIGRISGAIGWRRSSGHLVPS